ncbi:MAG: hypothetical protein P4L42_00635 [Desulfocapsaceae bacterium]|nr:hypothetical protein [Desulfocapsaceae bacterium]
MSVQIKKKNHFLRVNAAVSPSTRIGDTAHTISSPDEKFPDGRKHPLSRFSHPECCSSKAEATTKTIHSSLMRGASGG